MQPDMFETPFEALRREKATLVASLEKAQDDLRAFYDKAKRECTHDVKEPKEKYYQGDYDSRAHTERWDECLVCGAISNKWSSKGGSYG